MVDGKKKDRLKVLLSELRSNTEYATELQQAISIIPKNKVRESLEQELEIKDIIIKALKREIAEAEEGGANV